MSERDLVRAAAVGAAIAAAITVRTTAKRAFERRVLARLSVGRDGVIPGAEPIDLRSPQADAPAALLLHGFGDTPQTLTYLAASLHQRGWSVRAPLLPGHGRTIALWARTRAEDWLTCARAEFETLRRAYGSVAVVGLSMGGALAALLAADTAMSPAGSDTERPSPREAMSCLVLLAPYFVLPAWIRGIAALHPILESLMPYYSARGGVSILDPVERDRSLAYGVTTPRLVHELGKVGRLAWARLPRIVAPTLLMQSHADNRTTPVVAERALARIGSTEKQLVWLDAGAHVITVDHGRDAVAARVGEWLDTHTPSKARARLVRPA